MYYYKCLYERLSSITNKVYKRYNYLCASNPHPVIKYTDRLSFAFSYQETQQHDYLASFATPYEVKNHLFQGSNFFLRAL